MNLEFNQRNHLLRRDGIIRMSFRLIPYLLVLLFVLILGRIMIRGVPVLASQGIHFFAQPTGPVYSFYDEHLEFHQLTETEFDKHRRDHPDGLYLSLQQTMHGGGISGALGGTILLLIISMFLVFLIGFPTALFLSEYQEKGRLTRLIRLVNRSLGGVPPIVVGLFGLAFFCFFFPVVTKSPPLPRSALHFALPDNPDWLDGGGNLYLSFQGWGLSLIAMSATLACMALPVAVTGFENSLQRVPRSFRDAALSLGASRWQSIRQIVLRQALPDLLSTAAKVIVVVGGAAAPILFTGAVVATGLPAKTPEANNLIWKTAAFLGKESEALPFTIYAAASEVPQSTIVRQIQDGAVLVLTLVILIPVALSLFLQIRTNRTRR